MHFYRLINIKGISWFQVLNSLYQESKSSLKAKVLLSYKLDTDQADVRPRKGAKFFPNSERQSTIAPDL